MNFYTFLIHRLKSFLRAFNTLKSIVLVVLGLLYFGFMVAVLYVALPGILGMSHPGKDINEVFSSYVLTYLCFEFIARYFSQSVPQPFIQPYLHLAVPKNKLAHFAQILSLGSIFNFLLPSVVILLGINTLLIHGKIFIFLVWILPPIVGVFCSHYLLIFTRNRLGKGKLDTFIILSALALIFSLRYFDVIDLKPISLFLFFKNPFGFTILCILLVVSYMLTHQYQVKSFYSFNQAEKSKGFIKYIDSFFNSTIQYSIEKTLIFNEIKMMYRNSRPRYQIIMSLVFILLAYFQFYMAPHVPISSLIQFLVMGITLPSLGYLQMVMKNDSAYLDKYFTINLPLSNFLRSKFYMAYLLTFVFSIFTIGVAFKNLPLYILCLSFSYFITTVFSIAFIGIATMHRSGFKLNGSAMFFAGLSGKQIVLNMIITLFPILILIPFVMLEWYYSGAIFFGICAIIGFAIRESLIKEFVVKYGFQKYPMLEGFRKIIE